MNSNRFYVGNVIYTGDLLREDKRVEKNVLLIKCGNKFVRANYIDNIFDLISFYTILKYVSLDTDIPFIYYMIDKKEKNGQYVDKKTLFRLFDDKFDLDFESLKELAFKYNYYKEYGKDAVKTLKKKYKIIIEKNKK